MNSAHTCQAVVAWPRARYTMAKMAHPPATSRALGSRSAALPPSHAHTTLERLNTAQSTGIWVVDRPSERALRSRNASDELPSENKARMTRYDVSVGVSTRPGVFAAEAAGASCLGSRTTTTSSVAIAPGMTAIQKTLRIERLSAMRP